MGHIQSSAYIKASQCGAHRRGNKCSVFEFHGIDVMIAVNFAAKAFDKPCSCDQDITDLFWSQTISKNVPTPLIKHA